MNQSMRHFVKMHGLGNDFVVLNNLDLSLPNIVSLIPQLSHRHLGIGFDQVLVLEPATSADFFCRIYNADGSSARQCGNGLRCMARYVQEQHLWSSETLHIETPAGIYKLHVPNFAEIELNLGVAKITHVAQSLANDIAVTTVELGNPHAILQVEHFNLDYLQTLVAQIEPHFPGGINIGFMQLEDRQHFKLQTFERGVGATFACGSNAAAAFAAGVAKKLLATTASAKLQHGNLQMIYQADASIIQVGPAIRVFEGQLPLDNRH